MDDSPLTLYIAMLAFVIPTVLFIIKEFPKATKAQNWLYFSVLITIIVFFWWALSRGNLTL